MPCNSIAIVITINKATKVIKSREEINKNRVSVINKLRTLRGLRK
jgi:hypothetical protein